MSSGKRAVFRFLLCPLICVIAYFCILYIAAVPVLIIKGENYLDYEGHIYLFVGLVGITACAVWWIIKKHMGFGTPPVGKGIPLDWTYAAVSAFAMLGVAILYFYFVQNLRVSAVQKLLEEYDEMMDPKSVSRVDEIMNFIGTCFLIPVLEEILFRGFLLEGMLELKKPLLAILASAVVFGGMHGQPIQIGYAFLAGLMLGALYYLTRNLVMTIVAHMIFNIMGNGIYIMFNVPSELDNVLTVIEIAAIVFFIAITVYMGIKRKTRFPETGKAEEN